MEIPYDLSSDENLMVDLGDHRQLQSVLLNVIINAFDTT